MYSTDILNLIFAYLECAISSTKKQVPYTIYLYSSPEDGGLLGGMVNIFLTLPNLSRKTILRVELRKIES
jgi:hypothetical protein